MPCASSAVRRTSIDCLTYVSRALRCVSSCVGELVVLVGVEVLEREVLELPLDLPDAETLRERRVDLLGLASDADLLVGRQRSQRPHVVEPVGELDEDDPHVLGHGQQHLPDVLGLLLLDGAGAQLGELRDAVDELRDL